MDLAESSQTSLQESSEEDSQSPDGLVRKYEEHEAPELLPLEDCLKDSCYSCCWSTSDAWAFASVSFDGKLAPGLQL